jgi:transposase InsO family protein
VRRVREQNWTVRFAAQAAGVSRRTAHKWLQRFDAEGLEGLADRTSRPRRIPFQTAAATVRRIEQLRRRRLTAWEIASRLRIPPATVSKVLRDRGLGRLWRVEQAEAPPRRYEHARPGSLLHLDAKKLGKIEGVGHRIHGDRRRRARGVGWEITFVAVDDHTRLAYAELAPAESGPCAVAFLGRALRWFEGLGIAVERILSDNAKAYTSKAFTAFCATHGIRQRFTRPYTPRTNGKAERFIQTLTRRWAYGKTYRTSAYRAAALRPWLAEYNHRRPHRALGMRPPMARLRDARKTCEERP